MEKTGIYSIKLSNFLSKNNYKVWLEDAIKICTLNGAKYLEQENTIGTVEAGKIADFILINGDLKSNIKHIRNMETIFKDGVGFDSKKLFESVKGLVGLN